MKQVFKSLLLIFLVPLIVVAVVLGVLGSRALLENFSYETRAWEYLYMQPHTHGLILLPFSTFHRGIIFTTEIALTRH